MSITVGVDFTASNKPAIDPASLHYRAPTGWNNYQKAIIGVGGVLCYVVL
jgi:hypothetical protein